jgi:tetratricopeptide (TPR) repeat protein
VWGSRSRISADRGGGAAGRDIIGIMPEDLPAILKTATDSLERLNATQQATIADLGRQLEASKEQVLGFFRIIGEARIEIEAMPDRLVEIAERYKALVVQADAESGDDFDTARLKAELRIALDKFDLDRADVLLEEVLAAQDHDLESRALQAAATCAQRGNLARTRLRYNDAATYFGGAAARVPAGHDVTRGEYLFHQAVSLYQQGDEFGDDAALKQSIEIWYLVLAQRTRERVPLDWAMTQNNLGATLQTLGERESGTTRLEEAVAAHRDALKERTRERAPLDWATTRNNLGNALWTLGKRESSTARLEEAVAAYRDALKEWTRERVPLDWAMTQNNLGATLRTLGERESGTARLQEAVAACRNALKERTRERVPLQWLMTQNNLGNALVTLAERESGTARIEEALGVWEACLTLTVSDWPAEWIDEVRSSHDEARAEIARRLTARRS